MKQIAYIIAISLLPLAASAQTLGGSRVRVEAQSLTLATDGQLMVGMNIVLPADVKITSNRMATFTPILQAKDKEQNKVLPAIYAYGRRRQIVNSRSNNLPTDAYKIFRRKNGTEQVVNYVTRIPFQPWMKTSELELLIDLCGCGNNAEEHEQITVAQMPTERYIVKPAIAFVTPQVEAVKARKEEGHAFLDFPVNQTKINIDYRRNPEELEKIRQTIELVKNDANTTITGLSIVGFASPEGKYESNARLAQGRSEALKRYVLERYNMDNNLIRVSSIPEDWAGLRTYVANSNLSQKDQILTIIDKDGTDYDTKELKIKAIDGRKSYDILLQDCYPALRHSDYSVQYVVRGFSVEESKKIIRTRPQQLSLDEMFRLAQSFGKGSDEFKEVFDVAVRMFPNDPIANVNAAAIELQRGNLQQAAIYLERADAQASATLVNKGVLALLQGDLDHAETYFKEAQTLGAPEAAANLEQVAKKKENNALFGEK